MSYFKEITILKYHSIEHHNKQTTLNQTSFLKIKFVKHILDILDWGTVDYLLHLNKHLSLVLGIYKYVSVCGFSPPFLNIAFSPLSLKNIFGCFMPIEVANNPDMNL